MQQPHTEILLKQTNTLADKGSRHAALVGHGGEAGAARHLQEDIQVVKVRQIIHDSCTKN